MKAMNPEVDVYREKMPNAYLLSMKSLNRVDLKILFWSDYTVFCSIKYLDSYLFNRAKNQTPYGDD